MHELLTTYLPPVLGAVALTVLGWLWRNARKTGRVVENVWKQLDPKGNCVVKQLDTRMETTEKHVADLLRNMVALSASVTQGREVVDRIETAQGVQVKAQTARDEATDARLAVLERECPLLNVKAKP